MMAFKNGQHCWNHGAREARVHLKCGLANKLLSAEEPETCKYRLVMESPAACNSTYGVELRERAVGRQ